MIYLKCTKCDHLNQVNTEYLVFCANCGKKLENNFHDWSKKNSAKTFDDFKSAVCIEWEQNDTINLEKVKSKPIITIFIFVLGLLYIFLGTMNIIEGADTDVKFYTIDNILIRIVGVLIVISCIGIFFKKDIFRKALIVLLCISLIEFFIFIPTKLYSIEIVLGLLIGVIINVPGIIYFSLPATKKYFN